MMEHRKNPRIKASFKLLIYRKGVPVLTGRMVNVSSGGLYLRAPDNGLEINQRVEVEFQYPDAGPMERCRVPAIVVHKESSGLGLEAEDGHSRVAFSDMVSRLKKEDRLTLLPLWQFC
ncbi:PilZ domain-containing protein [Gallaecimonas kandeliae]|uniref:PilZ domain-containing protein n=1 Tax=Gallaecimonas kandeliae TaxID=3029055 RepID=UPI0026487236|nr:PilZ domain-containing protein [Gallaecimonas kandeliae]WKE64812.1 PilZ domain-containing protein [Gallaecimonas kandeliae]